MTQMTGCFQFSLQQSVCWVKFQGTQHNIVFDKFLFACRYEHFQLPVQIHNYTTQVDQQKKHSHQHIRF